MSATSTPRYVHYTAAAANFLNGLVAVKKLGLLPGTPVAEPDPLYWAFLAVPVLTTYLYVTHGSPRAVKRLKYSMGIFPKNCRTYDFDDMMELGMFLLENPKEVLSASWVITKYHKGDEEFRNQHRERITLILQRLEAAASYGADVQIGALPCAQETAMTAHNKSGGRIKAYGLTEDVSCGVRPMFVIVLRNGKEFVFYNINYVEGQVCFACNSGTGGKHKVIDVKGRIEEVMGFSTTVPIAPVSALGIKQAGC